MRQTTPPDTVSVEDLPPLPPRPTDAHKGTFGRVLVVAGSAGMAGAAALTANAALKAGAGLVKVASPSAAQPTVAALAPCATTMPTPATPSGRFSLKAARLLVAAAAGHDVLAIGPGMGTSPSCAQVVKALLAEADKPTVLDADGINNLCWLATMPARQEALIITPHPGEMRRLLAAFHMPLALGRDDDSRVRVATAVSKKLGCIVVLKGAGTVVADGARVYINRTGNPGMATGGTGDVLTGIIAALLGQGLGPLEAASLGVYLHGLAGDIAAARMGQHSLIASDLLATLPEAFRNFASGEATAR